MSNATQVIGKIIKHGGQTWRVIGNRFEVQVFGWHPTGTNPRFSWLEVEEKKVPPSVKELGT